MFGRFKTPSRKTAARALFVAATVAVTLELTACADLRQVASLDPGGVDPRSAIAREAVAASRSRPRMPRFAEIPKAPGDIVAALSIKSDVGVLVGERRALNRRIARLPPTQSDTDQFAARVSAPLLAKGLTPPPPDQAELTNDFAFVTRAGVQPPPDPSTPEATFPPLSSQKRKSGPSHP